MTGSTGSDLTDALAFTEATVRPRRRAADRQLRAGGADRLQEPARRGDRGRLRVGAAGDRRDPRALPRRRASWRRSPAITGAGTRGVRRPHLGASTRWTAPSTTPTGSRSSASSMALVDADGPLRGRRPGPAARRPVRRHREAARPPSTGSRSRASEKEQLSDYVVSLAVIGRGGLARERRIAPRDPDPPAHGQRRAGAGIRGQRRASTPSSRTAACRCGTWRPPG